MNESYHMWWHHVTYESVISCMNESYHIWMIHITYEWVISHVNESYHIWMSHITYDGIMSCPNKSCHIEVISHDSITSSCHRDTPPKTHDPTPHPSPHAYPCRYYYGAVFASHGLPNSALAILLQRHLRVPSLESLRRVLLLKLRHRVFLPRLVRFLAVLPLRLFLLLLVQLHQWTWNCMQR